MRLSFLLYIILAQFANGFLVDVDMNIKPKLEIKKHISRKQCLSLIGTSLITIANPIKKVNAISECDLNVVVEHNNNLQLNEEVESLEFLIIYQYMLMFFGYLISITTNFYK